ncbi:MAG: carbohydrate ABC transporter permease [Pseudomonadota bacterium]
MPASRLIEMTFLVMVATAMAVPFVIALLLSFMEPQQFMARGANFWPTRVDGYARALEAAPFVRYFINTVIVAGAITLGSLLTSILAAYVFARFEFPGRDALFLVVVATLMIPGHVTLIPNYLTLADLGLIDTYAALIVPFLASGFVTFFLRQHFRGIPRELDDAARIDGATRWQILWKIIVPMSRPAIAAMALFQFIAEWNSYLWPLIVTNSDSVRTLQIGLAKVYATDAYDGLVDWPMVMAGAVLIMLPTILVFVIAERNLTKGIAMTVSK